MALTEQQKMAQSQEMLRSGMSWKEVDDYWKAQESSSDRIAEVEQEKAKAVQGFTNYGKDKPLLYQMDRNAFMTPAGAPSWAKQQGQIAQQGVFDQSRYRQAFNDRALQSQGLQDLYNQGFGNAPSFARQQGEAELAQNAAMMQSQIASQRGGYNPSLAAIGNYAGGIANAQTMQQTAIAEKSEREAAQRAYLEALQYQRGQDIEFEKQMNAQKLAGEQAKQQMYGMGLGDKFQVAGSQAAYQKAMMNRDTNLYNIAAGVGSDKARQDAQNYINNMNMYGNIATGATSTAGAIAGGLVKNRQQGDGSKRYEANGLKKPYGW